MWAFSNASSTNNQKTNEKKSKLLNFEKKNIQVFIPNDFIDYIAWFNKKLSTNWYFLTEISEKRAYDSDKKKLDVLKGTQKWAISKIIRAKFTFVISKKNIIAILLELLPLLYVVPKFRKKNNKNKNIPLNNINLSMKSFSGFSSERVSINRIGLIPNEFTHKFISL